eukprot:9326258-Prorocentrum_lima.AAC.1
MAGTGAVAAPSKGSDAGTTVPAPSQRTVPRTPPNPRAMAAALPGPGPARGQGAFVLQLAAPVPT